MPYVRVGYAGFGLVVVVLIFYCAFPVVALTTNVVLCLRMFIAVSLLPV